MPPLSRAVGLQSRGVPKANHINEGETMMEKTLITPEQIVTELNTAMAESEELDGDCMKVLEKMAKVIGRKFDAVWS